MNDLVERYLACLEKIDWPDDFANEIAESEYPWLTVGARLQRDRELRDRIAPQVLELVRANECSRLQLMLLNMLAATPPRGMSGAYLEVIRDLALRDSALANHMLAYCLLAPRSRFGCELQTLKDEGWLDSIAIIDLACKALVCRCASGWDRGVEDRIVGILAGGRLSHDDYIVRLLDCLARYAVVSTGIRAAMDELSPDLLTRRVRSRLEKWDTVVT